MERQEQLKLIDNILQLHDDSTTHMLEQCSAIDTQLYTDAGQYQAEEQQLFRKQPVILGHASQLPEPGDFLTREVCGVPVIILRRNNGELRAFINVCKHRGGRMVREAEGKNLRLLVCQYHAWSYNTDGSLRGVPHKDGFSNMPEDCKSLSELPLSDRFGFLWVRLSPYQAGESKTDYETYLTDYIGPQVSEDLASYKLDSHVVFDPKEFHRPINWKLAIDTFLENYHVKKTHRDTIDVMFLDTIGYYEKFGLQQRNLYPKKSIVGLKDQNRDDWQLRDHGNMLYTLFPNTLVLIEPDHINVSIVYPEGIDQTHLINFTLLPEAPSEKGMAYFRRNNKILYAALEEDFSMAIDVQRGLTSGANSQFLHGRFEQGLKYFHENVDKVCQQET